MKTPLLLCVVLALPVSAWAASSAGTSAGASSAGSSASSGSTSDSSSGKDKIVLEAREDAAGFVASAGRIRGVRLEAALMQLREQSQVARQASDLQLAQAILAR